MNVLLLTEPGDPALNALHAALLADLGPGGVLHLTSADLHRSTWTYRQGNAQHVTLRAPGGHRVTLGPGDAVVQRLGNFLPPQFAAAPARDRTYAEMETLALWMSWLALAPCVVLPSLGSLTAFGPATPPALALSAACAAGLPTGHGAWSSRRPPVVGASGPGDAAVEHTALVVAGEVLNAPDPVYAPALRRLARDSEQTLLSVSFARAPGGDALPGTRHGWVVRSVGTDPDLRDARLAHEVARAIVRAGWVQESAVPA